MLLFGTILVMIPAAAVANSIALDDAFYKKALPLIEAGGEFRCKIPAPEKLVYATAENATAQLEALSVRGVIEAGKQWAVEKTGVYTPQMLNYALGDCFKGLRKCGTREKWQRETLAADLYNSTTEKHDYRTLMRLMDSFKRRHNVPTPPKDALVVHLRLGDVVRESPKGVEELLVCAGPAKGMHTQLKSVFELLYDARYSTNLSKVVLVGGSHTALEREDPSWFYAFAIQAAYEAAGYNVSLQLDPYPDEDFIFMSHASTFDSGCGGYSRFAGQVVERRGGRVVGRRFG
mmetsp:Transcript_3425/g.10484  ORF Transcript_3425/g.10484 Transcript_3425/m.10484 type:complete len:290 (-) Transcript_3425:228-1097(-)